MEDLTLDELKVLKYAFAYFKANMDQKACDDLEMSEASIFNQIVAAQAKFETL